MKNYILALLFICFSTALSACPFCSPAVVQRQIVYDNHHLMVLYDSAPITKGHLLVVPKRHIAKAHEISAQEWSEFSNTLPHIVRVFKKAMDTDQYLLLEKNGPYAGQTVSHVHFHIIPIPSQKIEDSVKTTLFTKMFNVAPTKLRDDELQKEVAAFRSHFRQL